MHRCRWCKKKASEKQRFRSADSARSSMLNHFGRLRITLKKVGTRQLVVGRKNAAVKFVEKTRVSAVGSFLTSPVTALPYSCQRQYHYSANRLLPVKTASMPAMTKFNYPKARRDETAIDVYHGTEVSNLAIHSVVMKTFVAHIHILVWD